MAKLTFFRQGRFDGGIRTGIEVEGDRLWHHYEAGKDEEDPALLWYVDVRCEGGRLPLDAEPARQWLIDQAPLIKDALNQLAEKLAIGFDDELWPYQFPIKGAPRGVSMRIVCSTTRALDVGELAKILRGLHRSWNTMVKRLALEKGLCSRS